MSNTIMDQTSVMSHCYCYHNNCSFCSLTLHISPFFFCFFFLPLLLLLHSNLCFAASPGMVPLGSALTPSSSSSEQLWSSPNSIFALSFYPFNHSAATSSGSGNSYEVGVIFLPSNTTVWYLKDVQVSAVAKLELTQDGELVLSEGVAVRWSSGTKGKSIVHGSMLDDGNFQLVGEGDISPVIWQTFNSPTDTILPNQKLTVGLTLLARGSNYSASLNGNLTLWWGNLPYWSHGGSSTSTNNTTVVIGAEYLAFSSNNGTLGIYSANDTLLSMWRTKDFTKVTGILRRVTLDLDGNLRIYSWGGATWSPVWQAVEDQCTIYGLCGPYGICRYESEKDSDIHWSCMCPAGFVAVGDNASGCRRIESLTGGCSQTMLPLDHTRIFINSANVNSTTSNTYFQAEELTCSSLCSSTLECFAAVALNDGSGTCYKILQDFASGYQSGAIPATSFIKSCPVQPGTTAPSLSSENSLTISARVFGISLAGAVLATLAVTACVQVLIWMKFLRGRFLGRHYGKLSDYASGAPLQFSYKELETATKRFRESLGCGGFGAVYKGTLANRAEEVVAVKRLEGAAIVHGEKQFLAEVATMGSTHHTNLVRLCGFCSEGQHRLLVYEFHRNGSLDRHLFEESNDGPSDGGVARVGNGAALLTWDIRFNIVVGTARAITYLHQECRDCIIHCDIKPENILLDDNFCAKVSDFGLARMVKLAARANANGRTNMTNIRGTRGYMAPEWRSNLPIDTKCDVYSFGVVVLEIVAGRRSFDLVEGRKFSEWAYEEYFVEGRKSSVLDSRMLSATPQPSGNSGIDWEEVDRCMRVAYWCMQTQPSGRPPMNRVVQMLEGTIISQDPPMISASTTATASNTVWHDTSQAVVADSEITFISGR